jgi:hypothetical protein
VNARRWKTGELAAATGVTVRTLRHFDQIGLLCPAERSAAGHRVYTPDDVRRLYRILALRELSGLAAEAGAHAERGTDPADPAVQELARRWTAAVAGLAGGDRNVMSAIYGRIEARGPEAATKGILGADAWDYLRRAFAIGFPGA